MGVSKSEEEIERFMVANRNYFKISLLDESFLGWVAVMENERDIVATGGMSFFHRAPNFGSLDGRDGYLLNMYTKPEWRGKGVATEIVKCVLEYARSIQLKAVRLHASNAGRPVYEKLGFIRQESEMVLRF